MRDDKPVRCDEIAQIYVAPRVRGSKRTRMGRNAFLEEVRTGERKEKRCKGCWQGDMSLQVEWILSK